MRKIIFLILIALLVTIAAFAIVRPDKKSTFIQLTKQGSCPDPFVFQMPVDLSKATSVLYPGQYRGGDYKPHGGFRFDNSRPDEIIVSVPYDAEVVAGARYPVNGEIQYTFDFAHPCGIRYRFGHLLTLSPKFQSIADKFPMPKGLDSRTTEVRPGVKVKQGEIIATAVGLTRGGPSSLEGLNTFVDWGVYDYRQKNDASKDAAWMTKHKYEIEYYAVCLWDWLAPQDRKKVLSLPSADYQSGKISDYCK